MQFIELYNKEDVENLVKLCSGPVAVDTEYDNKDVRQANLISVVLSPDGKTAYSIPAKLIKYLDFLKYRKVLFLQHFVVDYMILHRYGLDLTDTPFIDTMLLHHLIDENAEHSLDYQVQYSFRDNYKEVFWSKYKSIEEAPHEERLEYECKDAIYTYRLAKQYLHVLRDKLPLVDHVHKLARSLFDTELYGVRVNTELIKTTKETMGAEIQSYIPKLQEEFKDAVTLWELNKWSEEIDKRKTERGKQKVKRPEFNFASESQIRWLLYDYLQCPITRRTKKKNPSTDYDTILELSHNNPKLETFLKYKEAKTVYATFVEGMLDRVKYNYIYPRFNVNGTTTGRISHADPNMGNIPKEGVIRNFFIPNPGNVIIGADFSQLEVIVEANITEDRNLLRIILEGASKHDITAEGLKIPRDKAKTLNFALQYGAGPGKVKQILDCSYEDALGVFKRYWEIYSGVKKVKDQVDKDVAAGIAITNLFGRNRHLSYTTEYELAKAQRQGYNFLIQGTGADITHMAFYKFFERLKQNKKGRTWWEVHDEIIAEVKPEYWQEEVQALVKIMEGVSEYVKFTYPLKAQPYGPFDCWRKS